MKKTLITTLTLATIAVSPAFAQTTTDTTDHPMRTRSHTVHARTMDNGLNAYSYSESYADPYNVFVGNRFVGRDPDLNIRLQLRRDIPQDN